MIAQQFYELFRKENAEEIEDGVTEQRTLRTEKLIRLASNYAASVDGLYPVHNINHHQAKKLGRILLRMTEAERDLYKFLEKLSDTSQPLT